MSIDPSHLDRQRRFYESREHDHLRPRANDHYSEKLVARLADARDSLARNELFQAAYGTKVP